MKYIGKTRKHRMEELCPLSLEVIRYMCFIDSMLNVYIRFRFVDILEIITFKVILEAFFFKQKNQEGSILALHVN